VRNVTDLGTLWKVDINAGQDHPRHEVDDAAARRRGGPKTAEATAHEVFEKGRCRR